ncbi:MAG: hypothetical protein ABUK01_04830 [Leptospirales bacterium]
MLKKEIEKAKRYPGSRPYTDNDADRLLFFGREKEAQVLFHKILAENLTVLFSKSGIGKSSLINAGLMKPLREKKYWPVVCRIGVGDTPPRETIINTLQEMAKEEGVEISSTAEKNQNNLWYYFNTTEFWSKQNILLTPVIILDQFEELFTLIGVENGQSFIQEFSDLVRDNIPDEIEDVNLQALRSETGNNCKILLSIREDFLADLDTLTNKIPAIMNNRFRLLPMGYEAAKLAILKPSGLKGDDFSTTSYEYSSQSIETIISFLSKNQKKRKRLNTNTILSHEEVKIEPFQLQIICSYIENKIVRRKMKQPGKTIIEEKDLKGRRGMQKVLQNYVSDQLNSLGMFNKKLAGKLCNKGLISQSGRRLSMAEGEILRRFPISRYTLQQLVNFRILRTEPRLNENYYELSHDTLIRPFRRLQAKRKAMRYPIMAGILLAPVLFAVLFHQNILTYYHQKNFNDYAVDFENYMEEQQSNKKSGVLKHAEILLNTNKFREFLELAIRANHLDTALQQYKKLIQKSDDKRYVENMYTTTLSILLEHNKIEYETKIMVYSIKAKAGDSRFFYHLGKKFYKLKMYRNSIECFDTIINRNPTDVNALYYKARALNWLGEACPAAFVFETAASHDKSLLRNKNLPKNLRPQVLARCKYDVSIYNEK